jgi:hypothetical protein
VGSGGYGPARPFKLDMPFSPAAALDWASIKGKAHDRAVSFLPGQSTFVAERVFRSMAFDTEEEELVSLLKSDSDSGEGPLLSPSPETADSSPISSPLELSYWTRPTKLAFDTVINGGSRCGRRYSYLLPDQELIVMRRLRIPPV